MTVERELEICKWLKTAETEIEIKPNQYFALVKLLEDFHNEQLRIHNAVGQNEQLVCPNCGSKHIGISNHKGFLQGYCFVCSNHWSNHWGK